MTPAQREIYDRHRRVADALIAAHPLEARREWCSCVMVGKPCREALGAGVVGRFFRDRAPGPLDGREERPSDATEVNLWRGLARLELILEVVVEMSDEPMVMEQSIRRRMSWDVPNA